MARDEYRTPPEIFEALQCRFELDPCGPVDGPNFVPASRSFTRRDDGLSKKWRGMVWMNPPFGTRNGQVPWLDRFFNHGDGIGLVNALTSAGWFHDWMPFASALFFPRGKTKFIRPDGSIAKQPASGIVLFAAGEEAKAILMTCEMAGMCLQMP